MKLSSSYNSEDKCASMTFMPFRNLGANSNLEVLVPGASSTCFTGSCCCSCGAVAKKETK